MKFLIVFVLATVLTAFYIQTDFLSQQMKYARVKSANKEKESLITEKLKTQNLQPDDFKILLIGLKEEKQLQLFVKNKKETTYKKLMSYEICSSSGTAGPKRRQGDNQVPEGFYHIDRFNPVSSFYLSLGLNYPNQADRKKSSAKDLGGDIFIHGNCVSIGCMAMTDDKIKEIYLYAIHARQNGQLKIPMYIFPFRMTSENMIKFKNEYKGKPEISAFWDNLKIGYDIFMGSNKEIKFSIDSKGNYVF